MKALSVRQPWASLIASGAKTVELRTWTTRHRGPLVIVSSSRPRQNPQALVECPALQPLGALVCIVDLVDCRPAVLDVDELRACTRFADPRTLAWDLLLLERFDGSVRALGRLSLWDINDSLVRAARTTGVT